MLAVFEAMQSALKVMKETGAEILRFWEELIGLETKRLEGLKLALILYFERFGDLFAKLGMDATPAKLLKNFTPLGEVQRLLAPAALLSEDDVALLRELFPGTATFGLGEIRAFLVDQTPEVPRDPTLVRKYVVLTKESGMLKSRTEVSALVTVDDFLLVFTQTDPFAALKPAEQIFDLARTTFTPQSDGCSLEVAEKRPGLLFDSTERLVLRFRSPEERTSFLAVRRL
eukprot:TRINITY_DN5726_c0_g2_i3.p1 TRINITY_DN5726_c0_g2~~TRINITY_DN5726_c0_g2_i3.p1  ORF type:complete len:229 (-),score=42.79 TRINITY_DN5726_c0_g2_i3:43-729(-)